MCHENVAVPGVGYEYWRKKGMRYRDKRTGETKRGMKTP
jgi:hypothetical protein